VPNLRPQFSVITPVHDSEPAALTDTIASVVEQDLASWELCLVDDGSADPAVFELLEKFAAMDARIRIRRLDTNVGIADASNVALAMAVGDYVAFLDHDDLLVPTALSEIAAAIEQRPDVDVLYTDEDKVGSTGEHYDPFFKPDWSPEYLEGFMYLGHLVVYRRAVVDAVGGLRSSTDGAQDWDLALRVTDTTSAVVHVPKVLYHWRAVPGSTAVAVANKPHAVDAARRAVTDHVARTGLGGRCVNAPREGWFVVRPEVRGDPLVSVVIPTAGQRRLVDGKPMELVVNCLESVLERTSYRNFEIICVLDDDTADVVEPVLRSLHDGRIRTVQAPMPFNFSRKVNLGAVYARGSHLLLLNDDVEVISDEWMTAMLELSQREPIGAVGAKLYFGDGTIQHAGVVSIDAAPGHVLYRALPGGAGYFGNLALNTNYAAVTGACLMTRAEVFEEVGGLSTQFPRNYNDIDYCYKVGVRGYRVVLTPLAELYHYESSTRVPYPSNEEMELFRSLWGQRMARDPFYNPNFVGPARNFDIPERW